MFTAIMEKVQDNAEMVAFLEHEIELVSRKRTGSSKPTKRQTENEGIKARILEIMSDEGMTAGEVVAALNIEGMTNQRVSALLRQLVLAEQVRKETVKGKSLFYAC
jgi:hypothetical protein